MHLLTFFFFRLVNSVKDQVAAFIDGLNTLVPDNLLSIFDENELELLMCGTSEFNVDDLKLHHVAIGSSAEFFKVLSWFWTAVSNFTLEERSRLLQFTTGSSLLPAGGLADLSIFECVIYVRYLYLLTCFVQLLYSSKVSNYGFSCLWLSSYCPHMVNY